MFWFIEHERTILYVAYGLTLCLMFLDIWLDCGPALGFYLMTQAILVFRVFGVNWITYSVHVLSLVAQLVYVALAYKKERDFIWLILLIAISIQFIGSFHMMVVRPGQTYTEYIVKVGLHACMGLVTTIVFFWTLCYWVMPGSWQWLLSKFYMLVFLFIILTPLFQDPTQATVIVRELRRRAPSRREETAEPPQRNGDIA